MSSGFVPKLFRAPCTISPRFLPGGTPDPGFVRLKVLRSSVCNTDRRVMRSDKGHALGSQPIAIGHEAGGIRLDTMQKAIALPHYLPTIPPFFEDVPNLCPRMLHLGIHLSGLMADYADVPESCLYPIDDDQFDDDAMALVEPLACTARCLGKLRRALDGTTLRALAIRGGGPMGAALALMAKRFFKRVRVTIVEPNSIRRSTLKQLGIADDVVSAECEFRVDASIVASSSLQATEDGITGTKMGGTVMLFSGINSSDLDGSDSPSSQYYEDVHRSESDIAPILPHAQGRRLIGSSGYTREDVALSVQELSTSFSYYQVLQNVVIDGLSSHVSHVVRPTPKQLSFNEPAIIAYLAPDGIGDERYGDAIAESLKVLIRIADR